ncbi:MAG: serine hydrolase [Nitrospirota bacterium]
MNEVKKVTNITITRSLLWVLIAGTFALGVFVGRGTWLFSGGLADRTGSGYRQPVEDFAYIRLSITEGNAETRKIRELKPFRYKVDSLIQKKIDEEAALSVSVYFRDLDNGNWFGIREDEKFSPEIQLKLPILIAYFKWSEDNPLVLRKKILFRGIGVPLAPRYLRSPKPLDVGSEYAVNDLLLRMTAYGDNDAYSLLLANLPPAYLHKVAKDLYVNYDPEVTSDSLTLSAYASYFRVLFNASYLSEEMSEKALRYLARSVFREGMASGIPPDMNIASKTGERVIRTVDIEGAPTDVLQLHEFGIIYHPERPFLLGVTARGGDFRDLALVIRDITSLVYAEVDSQSSEETP